MPNLNPNPSDQIDISGNTFTLGATLPGTPTMGNVITNITGLNPGTSYYFAVVSFSNLSGYSGWAGPIVVYIQPEIREEIYAFAWTWDNVGARSLEASYLSGNTMNLFVNSEGFTGMDAVQTFNSNIEYSAGFTVFGGVPDPFGGNSAIGIISPGSGGGYYNIRHKTFNLTPGSTYVYSFWHHVTPSDLGGGATIDRSRIVDFNPDFFYIDPINGNIPSFVEMQWQQISPVVGPLQTEPTPLYGLGTGWQRFAFRFYVGVTLDKASPYIISKNNPPISTSGYTHYFYGFQIEEGNTVSAYKPTTKNDALPGVFYRGFYYGDTLGKDLVYTFNNSTALNFAPQNGLTYVSFLEYTPNGLFRPGLPSAEARSSGLTRSYNTYAGIERLKQLPVEKRVLQPNAIGNNWFWNAFYEDRLSGATGASTRFTENDAAKNYPAMATDEIGQYYNPWPSVGLTIGINLWTSMLQTFVSRGVTAIAGVYLDAEGDPFATDPSPVPLQLGVRLLPPKPQYSQQGINGISSWKNIFENLGGSLGRGVTPYVYSPYPDWIAWDYASKVYLAEHLNKIFYEPLQSIFGNSVYLSNYDYFDKEIGITAAAPDLNGHPIKTKRVGNATSPVCYGLQGLIAGNWNIKDTGIGYSGFFDVWVLDPNDSTSLTNVGFNPGGTGLRRGPWVSFIQGMQQIREARRENPNSYLTPWIPSVDYAADEFYKDLIGVCWDVGPQQSPLEVRNQLIALGLSGNTASFWSNIPPYIGWADVQGNTYNPRHGIYYTGSGGNSAYLYEFVRHIMLHGTKSIGYFNPNDFIDVSAPGNTLGGLEHGIYNSSQGYINYKLAGKTQHIKNMKLLNNTIQEVHEKIGGFTLTTADSSRISWIAPYLASGAPGPNGVTWWWRITTNPGNTTFVNGQTLSVANNNIVGTWVSTSGPTLSGVNITYA